MSSRLLSALALVLFMAVSATAEYTAPREGLDTAGMSYQLGVWSAILLIVVGSYGFYSLSSMDYSDDAALFVETPGPAEAH